METKPQEDSVQKEDIAATSPVVCSECGTAECDAMKECGEDGIKKACNGARMKKEVATEEDGSFEIKMEVIKAIPMRRFDRRKKEYRFIKSIVMTPRKIDKQNDWTTEDEIEDACHEFLINLQKSENPDESGISYRHQRLIKSDAARIVENTFTDFDEVWNGKTFPAGSWKIGVRVYDESMFPEIDRGELRGCSIEGTAVHTKEPLS